jgi:hypothetical protein
MHWVMKMMWELIAVIISSFSSVHPKAEPLESKPVYCMIQPLYMPILKANVRCPMLIITHSRSSGH